MGLYIHNNKQHKKLFPRLPALFWMRFIKRYMLREIEDGLMWERKSKGLCFRCGEKFHPLDQCAEKQLRLVIWGDS